MRFCKYLAKIKEIIEDDENALIFNLTSSGRDSGSNINESHWDYFWSPISTSHRSNCACIISAVPFPALLILGLVVMLSSDEIR